MGAKRRSVVSDKIPRYSVVGDRRGQEEHVPSTEECEVNSSAIISDRGSFSNCIGINYYRK